MEITYSSLYPKWYLDAIDLLFNGAHKTKVLETVPFGCHPRVWFCGCPGIRKLRRRPLTTALCSSCNTKRPKGKTPIYAPSKSLFSLMGKWLSAEQMNELLVEHSNNPYSFRPFFNEFKPLQIAIIRVLVKSDSVAFKILDEAKKITNLVYTLDCLKYAFENPKETLAKLSLLLIANPNPVGKVIRQKPAQLDTESKPPTPLPSPSVSVQYYKDSITDQLHILYPLAEYTLGKRSINPPKQHYNCADHVTDLEWMEFSIMQINKQVDSW